MFEKCDSSNRHEWLLFSAFQQSLWQYLSWFLFERLTYFYVTITGNFEHFQYFNFEQQIEPQQNF